MQYHARDIISLRKAAKSCRELAAWVDDGFSSLSYAQLADEIEQMIAAREALGGANPDMGSGVQKRLAA